MDISQFYIGRPVRIKTDDDIYDSYISAITLSDENFVYFKSGSLRNTLIDKLKANNDNAGNKLDVSGGVIKGILQVNGEIYINGELVKPSLKPILLWQNPNPTSSMDTQTITLNSSNYDMYEVLYRNCNTEDKMMSQKAIKGAGVSLLAVNGSAQANTYIRDIVYVNNTTLTINRCANPNVSWMPEWAIPVYIIGYKTGLLNN